MPNEESKQLGKFKRETVCVILAAGQGTRMRSHSTHKVCFPVAGRPAVNRVIDSLKTAGYQRFLLVVGTMAGQVVSTVGEAHPEATFAYQAEQLGTGHAAQVAARSLEHAGARGNVMIVMGDKVFEPAIAGELTELSMRTRADLVFVTAPKTEGSGSGRVVQDENGRVLGIVEVRDIQRSRILGQMLDALPADGDVSTSKLLEIAEGQS